MAKRYIWLFLFLSLALLYGNALGAVPVPKTTEEMPIPRFTVPQITHLELKDNEISLFYSGDSLEGTSDYFEGTVDLDVLSPFGPKRITIEIFRYSSGQLTGYIHDSSYYESSSINNIQLNKTISSYDLSLYYNASGEFQIGSIEDSLKQESYDINSLGNVVTYVNYRKQTSASYDQDGKLLQYIIWSENETDYYNAQGELVGKFSLDPVSGEATNISYSNGKVAWYSISRPDGTITDYDANGVMRKRTVLNSDGSNTVTVFGITGEALFKIHSTDQSYEVLDANDHLVEHTYNDESANLIYQDRYLDGVLVYRSVKGVMQDGTGYIDEYKNEVYIGRQVYGEGKTEQYDANGLIASVSMKNGNETLVYDGQGTLIERIVENDTGTEFYDGQGSLLRFTVVDNDACFTYAPDHTLMGLSYLEPGSSVFFYYDALLNQWYLHGEEYFGTAPLDLSALVLLGNKNSYTWYPNNTVCSFGPQFRDIKPDLTDLWYMFTPLDLSQEGTQAFELIGSNKYVLGTAYVTVSGDKVTVNYSTVKGKNGYIYIKSEYLNFFPDLQSVTTVVPEEIGKGFSFGQEISISKDLKGDTNVLMFIRNVATYRDYVTKDTKLTRYYKNYPTRKLLRDSMIEMMD